MSNVISSLRFRVAVMLGALGFAVLPLSRTGRSAAVLHGLPRNGNGH